MILTLWKHEDFLIDVKIELIGIRYTYEHVKADFESRGYALVSTEYHNIQEELKFLCKKHKDKGIQKIRYSNFIRGRGCQYCAFENGKYQYAPVDAVKDVVEQHGYIFCRNFYKNSNMYIEFVCPKHIERGKQITTFTSIKKGMEVCGGCNGFGRTQKEFEDTVKQIFPHIQVIGTYTGTKNHVRCKCLKHNYIWEPKASNLLSGFGCPICGKESSGLHRRIPTEEKLLILQQKHPDIEFLTIPETTAENIQCKCKKCGKIWEASYNNLSKVNYTSCPHCISSSGEKKIKYLLDEWGIEYICQKRFKDCKDMQPLPFDFYLQNHNILVEFDGEQHYWLKDGFTSNLEERQRNFEITQRHDATKTKYCKDKHIPLIRIPYWEKEDLEYFLFDKLVKYKVLEEININ